MADLAGFLAGPGPFARVSLARVRGSSPREEGATMIVSAHGLHGTIGGGQVEYLAIDEARALLRAGAASKTLDLPLGPEIGQCCGGRVEILIERMDDAACANALAADETARAALPHVLIFGAGHVGRALAGALALLPVRARLIDSRAEELSLATTAVDHHLTPIPEALVRKAPPGSAFVVLTHDHSLDFLVVREALARGDARYVGMIGSATKRAMCERWCRETGGTRVDTSALVCPIGGGAVADKRPAVIAALTAAEVMAALAARSAEVHSFGQRQAR